MFSTAVVFRGLNGRGVLQAVLVALQALPMQFLQSLFGELDRTSILVHFHNSEVFLARLFGRFTRTRGLCLLGRTSLFPTTDYGAGYGKEQGYYGAASRTSRNDANAFLGCMSWKRRW